MSNADHCRVNGLVHHLYAMSRCHTQTHVFMDPVLNAHVETRAVIRHGCIVWGKKVTRKNVTEKSIKSARNKVSRKKVTENKVTQFIYK